MAMEQDWQNNIFRIEERTAKLLEKEFLTDVTFAFVKKGVEEKSKILRAHKLILANASSVFQAMFYGPMADKSEREIQVEDIDSTNFLAMLKYIYSNELSLESWADAAELYSTAKMYMLKALLKYCIDYVLEELNTENALSIFEFATFYDEVALRKAAMKTISKETLRVLQSPDFLEIEVQTITAILQEDNLYASELQLFEALEKLHLTHTEDTTLEYCKVEPNSGIWYQLRAAVRKIRFLAMSAEEFSSGPANSGLLLPSEATAIINCLHSPRNNLQNYPKGFSRDIRKRIHLGFVLHLVIPLDSTIDLTSDLTTELIIELKFTPEMPKAVKSFIIMLEKFVFLHFYSQSHFSVQKSKDLSKKAVHWYNIKTNNFQISTESVELPEEPNYKGLGTSIFFEAKEMTDAGSFVGEAIEGLDVVHQLWSKCQSKGRVFSMRYKNESFSYASFYCQ